MQEGQLRIDPEFRALIPPLTDEERDQLEKNLQRDGCRDPLVAWGGVLVDGHHRYEMCRQIGISFQVEELEFPSRDEAKIWILKNQRGRRNLNESQRAMLAAKLEEIYARSAKERMTAGRRQDPVANLRQGSLGKASAQAARDMKVSPRTVQNAKKVRSKGDAGIGPGGGDGERCGVDGG